MDVATQQLPVVPVRHLTEHADQVVRLKGWLDAKRSSGKIAFLQIRDGSGVVQVIASPKDVDAQSWEDAQKAVQESTVEVTGIVRVDARAPGGREIHAQSVRLLAQSEEYPITNKEHGTAFLMEHRHLWLRSAKQAATLRVRARVIKSIRDYFDSHDFVCVDAPIFTPNACEGTSTLFEVDYFGDKAYLTQSGQLYGEAAAMALGKIYVFGPSFRAEKSKTRRHLTEFWMIEPEVAYATLDDVMDLSEDILVSIVQDVLRDCRAELSVLERDVGKLEAIRKPFPRISYTEAVERMNAAGHPFTWGGDFGAPDEEALTRDLDRPVLVHRFPAEVKAFYMKRDPEDDRVALCVDVLAPEGYGEIIGGSQRADSLEFLEQQIEKHKLPKEAFEWYLDLRRYGSVPHGGFGMGIERCVSWICGLEHVRETIPYPRMLYRIYP